MLALSLKIKNKLFSRWFKPNQTTAGFFLVLLAVLFYGCAGASQFELGEDPETRFSEDLNAIHFVDGREGWAVGNNGSLLHTTNGGASWTRQDTGSSRDFRDVYFVDQNNGWIVGEGGIILRTISAGLGWERQENPSPNLLNSVFFNDPNMGWAVGENGTILYTTDGGIFWLEVSEGERRNLNGVSFSNLNNGWIVGDRGLILHTDSGVNGGFWVTQISGTARNLYSIFWNGTQAYAVGSAGVVLKTAATSFGGGRDWVSLPPGLAHGKLTDVVFIRSSKGWISGEDGRIIYTEDGGQNWSDRSPMPGVSLRAVTFINENTGWAVGENGVILHTLDGGYFWINQKVR